MEKEATYNVQLTTQQWQVIGVALQEAPFRVAAPLLGEIQRQISAIEEERRQASCAEETQEVA